MIIRNWANYADTGNRAIESNTAPSETVPDMGLSMRDLLDRHLSGNKVKTFTPVYLPEDSRVPVGLERMDKVAKAQLAKDLSDFVRVGRGRLATSRAAAEKQRLLDSVKPAPRPEDVAL